MKTRFCVLGPLVGGLVAVSLVSCQGLEAPEGLWETEETGGPVVLFDLFARPLPEVPLPIDVATRPDRSTGTGLRINASQVAPTQLEGRIRQHLDRVDGWGTFTPITVRFEPVEQLLDMGNVLRRHAGDDFSFPDDAIYLVNVDPDSAGFGTVVPLDLGEGSMPVNIGDRSSYWPTDPREQTSTLLFDTYYEDTNGNGRLDLCEDRDHDGEVDPGEDLDGDGLVFSAERDEDGDGELDPEEDLNGNGRFDCGEDTDFDGHLDVPNLYCGDDDRGVRIPPWQCPDVTVDNPHGEVVLPAGDVWLTSWYEQETNTLILQPLIPLDERTTYAVVLTNRLVDEEGRAVQSPFPTVHHADQSDAVEVLPEVLARNSEAFGGLTIDDVQFAWTFTTQSVTSEMHDIREGLHGRGPLSELEEEFPPELLEDLLHGCEPGVACDLPQNRYIIRAQSEGDSRGLLDMLEDILDEVDLNVDIDQETIDHVALPFSHVDYMVHFRFPSPNFLETDGQGEDRDGDGRLDLIDEDINGNGELDEGEDLDFDDHLDENEDDNGNLILDGIENRFDLDIGAGHAPHGSHLVSAFAVIPRARPERGIGPPYPVVIYSNGYGFLRLEVLLFAAHLAKFGIASIGVDDEHHGLEVEPFIEEVIRNVLAGEDLAPMGEAVLTDGALDLDGDGGADSGGDFISAYVFRMRDMVRQSVVNLMQMVRLVRSFDGERLGLRDLDGDGQIELAGDWNADGVPDLGGPDVDLFSAGTSLGAIVTTVFAGLEPEIVATVPISGGGGLSTIGAQSDLGAVQAAVILRMLAPISLTTPATREYSLLRCTDGEECGSGQCEEGVCRCEADRECAGEAGYRCHAPPTSLAAGGDVCADQQDTACSMDQISARLLMPQLKEDVQMEYACLEEDEIQAGDTLVLRNLDNGEAGCFVVWPDLSSRVHVPADEGDALELTVYEGEVLVDTEHCVVREDAEPRRVIAEYGLDATYEQQEFLAGEPFVSPIEGFGHHRASPSLRRFISIAQIALESADPANMVRHHFVNPVDYGERTGITRSMIVTTVGDGAVAISNGIALGRAAEIVDLYRPDPRLADEDNPEGRTHNRYLIDHGVIMGVPRLSHYRRESDARQVFFDADDLDRSGSPPDPEWTGDGLGEPSAEVPLRLWRPIVEGETCTCVDDLGEHDCSWPGDTEGVLQSVRCEGGVASMVLSYFKVDGQHAVLPDPGRAFDVDIFMSNMLALYIDSRGTELHWDLCMEDSSCTVEEHGFYTPPDE